MPERRSADIAYQRFAELRYVGQGHQVKVRIPDGPLDESMSANAACAHSKTNIVGSTVGRPKATQSKQSTGDWWQPRRRRISRSTSFLPVRPTTIPRQPLKGTRRAFVQETGNVRRSAGLRSICTCARAFSAIGPAIIEENESTIVIGLDAQVSVDDFRKRRDSVAKPSRVIHDS